MIKQPTFISRSSMNDLLAYAVLAIAMLLTYYGCLGHDLVFWDDPIYVVYNEAAKGFSLAHLQLAFTQSYSNNYAPLQIVSYMLDYQIWGMTPRGFILTNLLLHFANGVLIYRLYNRLFSSKVGALIAATLFLIHPVQVESVAWVSQRKNVLAMFFFLLSFGQYIRASAATRQKLHYWLSVLFYMLALLTKVAAIVLPLMLFLYDLCYDQRDHLRNRLKGYLPYLILSLILATVAILTQRLSQEGIPVVYYGGTFYQTALTMLVTFPDYLFNIGCPLFLSAIYSPPVKEFIDAKVIVCALLMALFILEGVVLFRQRRELFFWYALFFVSFIPVLQIVPLPTIIQDRYCYFPFVGLCGFGGLIIANSLKQATGKGMKFAIIALCCAPLPLLMVVAKKQAEIWQDPLTLFRETARKGIGSRYGINTDFVNYQMAEISAAMAQGYLGKVDDRVILNYYFEGLAYEPTHYQSLLSLANLLLERGNHQLAQKYFRQLTKHYPKSFEGFYGLGQTYQQAGNTAQAEEAFRHALTLNPAYEPAAKALQGR